MRIPIISNILERRQRLSTLENPSQWLYDALRVGKTITGVTVNEDSALNSSAVYACVRLLSETIASLPLLTYKRTEDGGKIRDANNPMYKVLHLKPIPTEKMTAFTYREQQMKSILLWGNMYSLKLRTSTGSLVGLFPLMASRMKVDIDKNNNNLEYRYLFADNIERIIPNQDILHIPGMTDNGLIGKSVIQYARESIALGITLEEFGSRFFANGTNVGGMLQHPAKLTHESFNNLKEQLADAHQGLSNAHKMIILEEGMTFEKINIPPNDAQFLESRKFQLEEICRWFNIPQHLANSIDRATFNNIEHLGLGFVIYTLRPWLVRIEQGYSVELFDGSDDSFCEFLVDGLLRGDIKSRYEAYSIARQNGILNANEIRALENRNPYEGGDSYIVQLNMQDVKNLGKLDNGGNDDGSERTIDISEVRSLPLEDRALRSANTRSRLAKAYKPLFENIAIRIIKREKTDVLKIVKKSFGERDYVLFADKVTQYYDRHRKFVGEQIKPAMVDYSNAVAIEAADEVNLKEYNLNTFINKYEDRFESRYTKDHAARMRFLANKAIEENADPYTEIESQFDHWEDQTPQDISTEETIRLSGAVSREIYGLAGVTKLVWRNAGSKTCPFCESLDGVVVGIDEPFLTDGTELHPEGADSVLRINGTKFHAPAHTGCVCMVSPE